MELPVMPPLKPMLAKAASQLPEGQLIFEPKWDGFRGIIFRDGDEVEIGSRSTKPLTRYFPDVVEAVRKSLPERCVVDGEVVIAGPEGLDFDALSQRIHPAKSRVDLLARTTPASLVVFDLLALEDTDLRSRPFSERRALLEECMAGAKPPVHITPATRDREVAIDWFSRFEGAGLDGVVAKGESLSYQSDKRVMVKVKHERTGDFVVAGFRWYKNSGSKGESVGSLMLGLYDSDGGLNHVGVIGSFAADQRRQLVEVLAPYRSGVEGHPWARWMAGAQDAGEQARTNMTTEAVRQPGAKSRWNAQKDLSFELLRPELVVEAAFEHLQGRRLRHTARFRRWRPDRDPTSATYDQLDVAVPAELADVFAAG